LSETNDIFSTCSACKRNIDLFHPWQYQEDWNGGHICKHCVSKGSDASVPPWPDHMMQTIEPYIQWRENRAISELALRVVENRIEK